MKTVAVSLNKEEINALQISISAAILKLQEEIDRLKDHNKTGINTNKIRQKVERINDLNALFDKMYRAEQFI